MPKWMRVTIIMQMESSLFFLSLETFAEVFYLVLILCVAQMDDTTTYSTERSEHFKPCRDKDLAYCLNDGECFVIETLTGSHKHCR
uniref:Uncharacterized protein n=1 Tax=Rangifer tarandus platyrhynchus TaxID=3082113 RepID=A0ACB0FFR1_RANTA|nr:unnamed protein product [Rangifer tarandus platyrhynchus]